MEYQEQEKIDALKEYFIDMELVDEEDENCFEDFTFTQISRNLVASNDTCPSCPSCFIYKIEKIDGFYKVKEIHGIQDT